MSTDSIQNVLYGERYIMKFDLIQFLKTKPTIAVVGATNDSRKYGNIIMKDLISRGFTALPVNPRATTVEGIRAYPDLERANSHLRTDLIVYVVPPAITLESLKEAEKLNIKNVWVQPGAGDESVKVYLERENFNYLMNACVMMEAL